MSTYHKINNDSDKQAEQKQPQQQQQQQQEQGREVLAEVALLRQAQSACNAQGRFPPSFKYTYTPPPFWHLLITSTLLPEEDHA